MAGPFDFLHLKSHTEGSSNELTFDVLEAASRGLDGKKDKDRSAAPTAPKPSQGSYHGVGNTSTLSNAPEVTRRKRARRARAARSWLIAVVAVAALVGTGVFFGYQIHQERVDFSDRFNHLIDRFIEIDHTMVEVDSLMADPLNSVELVKRSEVSDRFSSLARELNATIAAAHELEPSAKSDEDRSALAEVEKAANARSDMLDAAESAFTLSKRVNQLADSATDAWKDVLEGDSIAREAAALANKASNEEETNAAREKTQQARDFMDGARVTLSQVAKEQPGIDFSAETAYVNKRIESLDAAVKTADALLANDRDAARSANDAYNAADSEAAALAGAITVAPAEHVRAAFQSTLEESLQAYTQARATVTAADSSLRAYL